MGFSRQEYWSGLPFPSPGDLPGRLNPRLLLGRWILYHWAPGEAPSVSTVCVINNEHLSCTRHVTELWCPSHFERVTSHTHTLVWVLAAPWALQVSISIIQSATSLRSVMDTAALCYMCGAGQVLVVNNTDYWYWWGVPGGSVVKNPPAESETWAQSLVWEDSPGEGSSNPLQYSSLENPKDRAAWRATVHEITESDTT